MLPMIVNVNLTKGTKTLAKKKTLVKNIQAIQNLGAIDILCTDKTGTLTQNKMTVKKVFYNIFYIDYCHVYHKKFLLCPYTIN